MARRSRAESGTPARLKQHRPSTFPAACLWCGRTLLVLLAVLSAGLLATGNARAQGTVATDRAALVALYEATGGPTWTINTNWSTAADLSEWHGVTTDATGRVTEVSLSQNMLSGEIPAELGNLTSLERLYASRNMLSGEIPAELGNLTSLKFLSLWGNELSGEIPAELGNLTSLEILYLNENMLSGEIPAELGNLTSLRRLYLSENMLSGEIPAELGNLTSLQRLFLSRNMLSGEIPAELGDMTSLQRLSLWGNELTGEIPAELGNLVSLEVLYLHENMLSGEIPAELGNLVSLQKLYLWDNELTGAIPAELGSLSNLQELSLSGNMLDGEIPAELGDMTSLQRLYLWGNELTGEIPAELGNLTNLLLLYLHSNELTGAIPAELGSLSNLQELSLSRNMLSGEIPAELGNLTSLEILYLHENMLSGEIPAELGNLTSLEILYLHENMLSGEIPAELGRLANLRYLFLHNNELTGPIPPGVAPAQDRAVLRVLYNETGGADWTNNMNWLSGEPLSEWYGVTTDANGRVTILSLSANGLTGTIAAELGVLTHLQRLYLNGNNGLTGTIPPELENLVNLQVFDVRNTGLSCVTPGSQLHTWLTTINSQGAVCATRPPRPPRPRTSAPGAPRNLTAAVGNGEVVLSWEAPARDGGAAITDYEYRIDRRNPWISIGSTNITHTVTGLDNGTAYVFEVRAVNRIGKSFSSNRAEATPEAPEVFALDFAHFANGTGITSEMVLVNVAPHPIRPAIYFYDRGGRLIDPASVVDVTVDLEVTEDGGLTVRTEMEPLGELTISTHGQGELVSGSVKVLSDGPIGGGVRYGVPEIGVAGVGASPPVRDVLFPARRQEGGIRTATALHNLGEEAMGVSCRLMSAGVALEEVEIPLEANGQTSWFIEEAFTTTDTADFLGSVRCTAPGRGRFTAIAVEMDAAQRIFNTLSVVPVDRTGGGGGETVLNFAHFVNGTWITDLVFLNPSIQPSGPPISPFHTAILPSRPAIYFYDTEGNPIAAESVVDITGDLEIGEDGALTVRTEMEPLGVLTISTHGRGALVSGSVRVVSEGPIGGMLRFEHPDLGVAGVGASPPVSDALFPVRRQEGGITTGVALHNLESSAGLVHCDLMREGVLLDGASIPLEANGQTAWLIDQAFPGTDTSDFAGSVRCSAPGGDLFTAVALEMDPGTRIFTTLPVVPVPERTDRE